MKKSIKLAATAAAAIMAVSSCIPAFAESWVQYRGNNENNGVVTSKTPVKADDTALYWATKVGTDWTDSPSPVTLVDDKLVFTTGDKLCRMNKETGEIDKTQGQLVAAPSYALMAPTYADGMIFVGLSNGYIQAFDADTLKSLWVYQDQKGGSVYSSITYSDGYIYTGFFSDSYDESADMNFVCIDVTDEQPDKTDEKKSASWTYASKGGFYFAGAYASDNYVAIGTEDGEKNATSETAKLVTLDKKTGKVIDKHDGIKGDVRSAVAYDKKSGNVYFTTKGGQFCKAKINDKGKITNFDSIPLSTDGTQANAGPSTSTPVIANGRAYVGVGGNGWGDFNGSGIMVIDLDSFKVAYKAETQGYPQVSGLATTAYTDKDGYNYVYFVDNTTPSSISFVKDKKGVKNVIDPQTKNVSGVEHKCAPVLFTPSGEQANYAIANLISDSDGTIYFKNDSSYIMSIGNKVKSLSILAKNTLYKEGEKFDKSSIKVTAVLANGDAKDVTSKVKISDKALTTDDTFVTATYDYALYGDADGKTGVKVEPVEATVDIDVLDSESYDSVKNVIDLINSIGKVTSDSGDAIATAREAYEALDDSLKGYVSNYNVLKNAEEDLKNLNSDPSDSNDTDSSKKDDSSKNDSKPDNNNSSAPSTDNSSSSGTDDNKNLNNTSNDNPGTGAAAGTIGVVLATCAVIAAKKKNK